MKTYIIDIVATFETGSPHDARIISPEDDGLVDQLCSEYQGMKRAQIARILVHYALGNASAAMGEPAKGVEATAADQRRSR